MYINILFILNLSKRFLLPQSTPSRNFGIAKIEKLIICIISFCVPCDFIFANLALNISDFLDNLRWFVVFNNGLNRSIHLFHLLIPSRPVRWCRSIYFFDRIIFELFQQYFNCFFDTWVNPFGQLLRTVNNFNIW